jgi:hypothetical protein
MTMETALKMAPAIATKIMRDNIVMNVHLAILVRIVVCIVIVKRPAKEAELAMMTVRALVFRNFMVQNVIPAPVAVMEPAMRQAFVLAIKILLVNGMAQIVAYIVA